MQGDEVTLDDFLEALELQKRGPTQEELEDQRYNNYWFNVAVRELVESGVSRYEIGRMMRVANYGNEFGDLD